MYLHPSMLFASAYDRNECRYNAKISNIFKTSRKWYNGLEWIQLLSKPVLCLTIGDGNAMCKGVDALSPKMSASIFLENNWVLGKTQPIPYYMVRQSC